MVVYRKDVLFGVHSVFTSSSRGFVPIHVLFEGSPWVLDSTILSTIYTINHLPNLRTKKEEGQGLRKDTTQNEEEYPDYRDSE